MRHNSDSASQPATTLKSYRVLVLDARAQKTSLTVNAISVSDAARIASARGLRVLKIESLDDVASNKQKKIIGAKFPLQLFSQELLALLDAGLNLTEALSALCTKERNDAVRNILNGILRSLNEGRNFSDVLSEYPDFFPPVYIATVRASERTGDLPRALERFIAYQVQFETIRKKIISASIYPAMLLVVGTLVTLFLLGYVVPRFAVVYESSGRELPWLSAVILDFGRFIHNHWQLAIVILVLAVTVTVWLFSQEYGRRWIVEKILSVSWLAKRADEFRLARFYRAVSLLLVSGISLPKALGMVSGLLSLPQQKRLQASRIAIEQGQSLSVVLVEHNLAGPVAESLLKVAEKSGQMPEMLERIAQFADDDFSRWVDWASRLLEPVLMSVIGIVIGTIVVLMYLPIFELAGSLQ